MAVQVYEPRAGMGLALFLPWYDWLPLCSTLGILWPTLPFVWSYFLHIRRIKQWQASQFLCFYFSSFFLAPLSLSVLHWIWGGGGERRMDQGVVSFLKNKKKQIKSNSAMRKMGVKCYFKVLVFCQPSCNVTNIAPRDDSRLQCNWSDVLTISSQVRELAQQSHVHKNCLCQRMLSQQCL